MKKMYSVLLVFAIFFVKSSVYSQTTGLFTMNFDNNGIASTIAFYVPEDYSATNSYPLIYAWHGSGMAATNMVELLYFAIANEKKAIVCCPDINNILGDNARINNLVNATLGYNFQTFNIDTTKTIISGFSMGGGIAFQIGLMIPNVFKGIIGFSPAVGSDYLNQAMWDNLPKVRIGTILGDQDFNYAAVSAFMNELKTNGANLLYIEKPGVEHADQTYYTSAEFQDDYEKCYNYVLNIGTSDVNTSAVNSDVSVFPNPSNEISNVFIELSEQSTINLQIYNIRGELIDTKEFNNLSAGKQSLAIDTKSLSTGIYTLVLNYSGTRKSVQLSVVR